MKAGSLSSIPDRDTLKRKGREAQREIRRLLEERPELRPLQAEIDKLLAGSGNTTNRLAVLAFMMESKLRELQDQLMRLEAARAVAAR